MDSHPLPHLDLAVIGGGINGAGLAHLAARAGLSVALFEKGDFGSGTSSKSTKLIHGGIRYLEQTRFKLVFEALHERRRLLETVPHLVRPIPFLLPSYRGDRRPAWMLKAGLGLYDLLAGTRNIGRHRWFSPAQALEKAPLLKAEGLQGCGLYFDAQVNDARLVLENILAAESAGARCFNYRGVERIEHRPDGFRLFHRDLRTGENGVSTAACLANASGPWANQIGRMVSGREDHRVRPSRGSHLVVPQVLSDHAVLVTTREDNRIIFVIPWRGYSLVGTTDLDDFGDPDRVRPTQEEIGYLLREASRVFPGAPWDRSRVISAFAGLRPLAWAEGGRASSVSREDRILRDGRLLTIVGGKLTTYRSMAERALKLVFQVLGKPSVSVKEQELPGSPSRPWDSFFKEEVPRWASAYSLPAGPAGHLARLYGRKAVEVLALLDRDPRLAGPLHPQRPELLAQVAYAVRSEKALRLEDVLMRRLEIGYAPERWGEAAEKASRLMGEILGWSEETRQEELQRYQSQLYPPPKPRGNAQKKWNH